MFERVFGISQKQKSTMFGAIDFGAVRYLGDHRLIHNRYLVKYTFTKIGLK